MLYHRVRFAVDHKNHQHQIHLDEIQGEQPLALFTAALYCVHFYICCFRIGGHVAEEIRIGAIFAELLVEKPFGRLFFLPSGSVTNLPPQIYVTYAEFAAVDVPVQSAF